MFAELTGPQRPENMTISLTDPFTGLPAGPPLRLPERRGHCPMATGAGPAGLETSAPRLALAAATTPLPRLPATDGPHRPAGSRPAALTPCTPPHAFRPSYPANVQAPNGANARLCPQPVMRLRFGSRPDCPAVQKPPLTSIGSHLQTPILPVRSPATSPTITHSPLTPQKQKTKRVRRARSTPDSIDAPRARRRLTSMLTSRARALRSMLSLFVRQSAFVNLQ